MLASETKEQAFVIGMQAQIIKYLEPRRSVGRIRNHLADFYRNVILDAKKAKELWLRSTPNFIPTPKTLLTPSRQPTAKLHQHDHGRRQDDQPIWQAPPQRLQRHLPPIPHLFLPREKIGLLEEMRILQQSLDGSPRRPSTPAALRRQLSTRT
ncbi:unnamed protein product [Alternaria alternata]